MERFLSSAIQRPIAACAVALVVLALGTTAVLRLPLSLKPDTEFPALTISFNWPGASSEAVVKHLTALIESEVVSVPGVVEVSSETREGMVSIRVNLDRSDSIAATRTLLRDRLASLRPELPLGVLPPSISEIPPEIFRDLEGFMSYRLSGPLTDYALRTLALKEIAQALLSVDGVSDIDVIGGREEELLLRIDTERLTGAGLTLAQVREAVDDAFTSHAAGTVRRKTSTIPLWTTPLAKGIDDLANLPVAFGHGQVLRLRDLAETQIVLATPRSISRLNGLPAITIDIARQPGSNLLEVARRVRMRMDGLVNVLPEGVALTMITDRSEDVQVALDDLFVRIAIALIAIIALLLLFLRRFRASIILLTSIGLSLLIAMICFEALGLGLDLLTLSGLALAFGILVDNAVVIYENIRRKREEGASRDEATVGGTSEMLIPVAATTLTTVVALLPVIYLSDEYRQNFGPFALGLGLTLLASIAVAGIWVPILAHHLEKSTPLINRTPGVTRFQARYEHCVARLIPWRWPISFVTLILFGVSAYLFATDVWKGPSFGWTSGATRIDVTIVGPPGMETSTVDSVALAFERYALKAGGENVDVSTRIDGTQARLQAVFSDHAAQTSLPIEIRARMFNLATHFGGLYVSVYGLGDGFSSGMGNPPPTHLRLLGYNYDDLEEHANRLARQLERHRRIRKVETSNHPWGGYGGGRYYELQFNPSQRTLVRAGMNLGDLNAAVGLYTDYEGRGQEAILDGRRIPYRLVMNRPADAAEFDRLPIRGPDFSLNAGDVGTLEFNRVPTAIIRNNQQYQRWISYEFVGTWELAHRYREAFLNAVELPPGYRLEANTWSGFDWGDSRDLYLAVCLAVVLVLLVTSALFESFRRAVVALMTVPMGLTGIFLVFWFFELSFDRGAFLGTIFMVGIVVNNAILLVDRMARLQRSGMSLDEAITTGCRQRLRPILITSLTTLVGLMPLLIAGHPSTRNLWISLSYTGLSGLTLSTLLVLFVTPALYRLMAPAIVSSGRGDISL